MVLVRTEQPFPVISLTVHGNLQARGSAGEGKGRKKDGGTRECCYFVPSSKTTEIRGATAHISKVLRVCTQLYRGLYPQFFL